MEQSPKIAVLLLAAGSSSRMGVPKQLLPWEKTTLIENAIETSLGVSDDVYVILGANAELIQSQIKSYNVQTVINSDWQNGLGSSIAFGIKHIQNLTLTFEGVLIMLADQPLIDTEHLRALIKLFNSKKQQLITTTYKKRKEGVPAIFSASYFSELSKLKDDFGAKNLIKNNITASVEASHKVLDIDTKADYKKLISQIG